MKPITALRGLVAASLLSAAVFAALPTRPQDVAGPSRAEIDFARIKALAGKWEVVQPADESHGTAWSFRVSAGGSAVLETLFEGSEHEMLTVYHLEDGELVLTHYCALGNQPHMHAVANAPENQVVFDATHVGNLGAETNNAMKKGSLQFNDDGTISTEWSAFAGDEPTGTVGFTLKRKDAGPR